MRDFVEGPFVRDVGIIAGDAYSAPRHAPS
jgi:hypothetical protein